MKINRTWQRSGRCPALFLAWAVVCSDARAQWVLSQPNVPVAEDFASFTAPSTWATANPNANQLDSDTWAFSQTNATGSTASTFGLNYISGRGVSSGGTTMAGVYAFDSGAGVRGIGPQASDSAWSPGNLTVKLQNDSGLEIEKLNVEWTYLIYNDHSGSRFSQLLTSNSDANGSYLAPLGGEVVSQDAPQGSLFWIVAPRNVILDVAIPDGGNYYLRWSFADLPGSAGSDINRDKIAIANLQITAGTPGDYNVDGTVDAADYVVWRKTGINGPTGYDIWQAHFGESTGNGLGASVNATFPEPAALMLLMFAAAGWCLRRCRAA